MNSYVVPWEEKAKSAVILSETVHALLVDLHEITLHVDSEAFRLKRGSQMK